MKINKIKLENIRSYLNQEINLPEGTVLLSGDIGSGKSTILLAAEFALFGLEKGSAQGLLRNGKDRGEVELHFELENKDIIIKRVLKRSNKSIKQDAGYVVVDGKKFEGTATELKAKILDLLNYPKDYLTKGKGLLYKYTVYTPQEEMKRILLESKEDRLHVLRKIFDIDKYKRIQENCSLFLKHLRSESRFYEERLKELDDKLIDKSSKENELKDIKNKIKNVEDELNSVKIEVENKRKETFEYEEKIKKLNELRNKISLVENNYNHAVREKERDQSRLSLIKNEIKDEKEEDFNSLRRSFENKLSIVKKNVLDLEEKIGGIRNKISGFNANENNSNEIKKRIKDLDECPTCYQSVKQEHKNRIFKEQDESISKFKLEIENLKRFERENFDLLNRNKVQIDNLIIQINDIEKRKIRYENFLRKEDEIINLELQIKNTNLNIFNLLKEKDELNKDIKYDVEESYRRIKSEFDEILKKERNIELKKISVDEKLKFNNELILRLENEINKLEMLKIKLGKLKDIETWMDKHFLNLMGTIERNVMYKLHSDFNELFEKWFDMIIDNENLKVELDEEFTPKILQDGYDINYIDLSGGEKTSVALAYRLSLNQILNNLVGEIKTKDLLILDEPTDGFSTEQLDRVRVVLDELNMKQIIIVSHEAKIESFVDKVLRFEKKEHVSEVV